MTTTTIERLRNSKITLDKQQEASGRVHGGHWAEQRAEYAQLYALPSFAESMPILMDEPDGNAAYAFERLFDLKGDFWSEELDTREYPSNAYVGGFVESALEVWEEVAEQV